jgi:simple sugar transport system permease protein
MMIQLRTKPANAAAAAAAALLVIGLLATASGVRPLDAYRQMMIGSFGSAYAVGVTFNMAVPLILAGLSFVLAVRAGQLNIGIEGQLYAGAIAATTLATGLALPAGIHLLAAVVAGAFGGAMWALIPALLKVYRGVSEIVSALLLNYVAIFLASFLLAGPLRDPTRAFPESHRVPPSSSFPVLFSSTNMSSSFVLALLLAGVLYYMLRCTTLGFEIQTIGTSPRAARFVGMDLRRVVLTAFLLSGAIGGLAGTCEVLGNQYRFIEHFSHGWGYTGIMVALLGGLSPLGSIIAGVSFAVLSSGANQMQRALGIPSALALVIEGTAVLAYLVGCYLPRPTWRAARRPLANTFGASKGQSPG